MQSTDFFGLNERLEAGVEIVDFRPEYRAAFKDLNLAWIEHYFQVEAEDILKLENPEAEILEPGGAILFARCEGEILGTCALIRKSEALYELSKMAVAEHARGRKIGKTLLLAAIEKARALGAKTLMLETNSKLIPAVTLYRQMGFVAVPMTGENASKYERADMRMELPL
jgi:GNAT superfamily N-acetyltransferase